MRRRWLVIVLGIVSLGIVAAIVVSVSSNNSTTPTTTAPTTPPPTSSTAPVAAGYLHTSGTRIVDSSGATVQLTGFNVSGMETGNVDGSNVPGACNHAWRPLTPAEVSEIAGYGFGSVRLPVAWSNLEPTAPTANADGTLTHHWNDPYVAALDQEISQLGAANIRVVLDMHQSTWGPAFVTPPTSKQPGCPGAGMPAWLNPNAASETPQSAQCAFLSGTTESGVPGTAWSDFAAAEAYLDGHFAGNSTVVGQDVINEPYCARASANLTGFYAAVVPQLHTANPDLLFMLEDRETPGSFHLHSLPDVPNVVLSVHLHEDYWTTPGPGQTTLPVSGEQAMTASYQRAVQWNVPLWVGEFYAFDAIGNQNGNKQPDANWTADTASALTYFRQNAIGWAYWSWIQKKNPASQPEITPALLTALQQG
ncbi:MAG: cellulase family glycosylhydrolase [Acidimicrobiales bacterium]|nr:cellulase family glycosylhydrolase [Acidimicrobiales bacterium]